MMFEQFLRSINGEYSDLAGYWGGIVATVLAVLQITEHFRNKLRITTSFSFRPIEQGGNDIILANHSPRPVTIFSFGLFWAERRFLRFRNVKHVFDLEDGHSKIELAPYGIHTLNFDEADYFSTRKPTKKSSLYIGLVVTGAHKPLRLKVY